MSDLDVEHVQGELAISAYMSSDQNHHQRQILHQRNSSNMFHISPRVSSEESASYLNRESSTRERTSSLNTEDGPHSGKRLGYVKLKSTTTSYPSVPRRPFFKSSFLQLRVTLDTNIRGYSASIAPLKARAG